MSRPKADTGVSDATPEEVEATRIDKLLSRSKLAKKLLDVIAQDAEDGDAAFDAAALVLATMVRMDVGFMSPPRTPLSGIARDHVAHLAQHVKFRRLDAPGRKKGAGDEW